MPLIPVVYTYVFMLGIFIYAGASDWKRREVDDIVSIAAWTVCWLGGLDLNILIASFLGFWLLSEVAPHLLDKKKEKPEEKKTVFGWADVLMVPPFMAVVSGLYEYQFAAILLCGCLVASQMWLKNGKKEHAPMVFFLACAVVIAQIIKLF